MTLENKSGVLPDDIAFRISSEYHFGFELLEGQHKIAAESGREVVVYISGAVEVVGDEILTNESDTDVMIIPAGTFPWITEDYQAPFEILEINDRQIKLVDISDSDKKLSRLGKRLNGSTGRGNIAVRQRVSESVVNGGIVSGAQPFLDNPNFPTIFSIETGDTSNSKKVRVYFTLPSQTNEIAYKVAACTFTDQKKTDTRLKQLQS